MEYSDLIYIFLDGEASEDERTLLFSALATDNALQTEFQDAFRMHTSVQKEIETTTPPLALTTDLFAKAGFAEAKQDEPKKKAAWFLLLLLFLKNWGIPIASAVGGAIVAIGIMMWNYKPNSNSSDSIAKQQDALSQPREAKQNQTGLQANTESYITHKKRSTALPLSSSHEIVPETKPSIFTEEIGSKADNRISEAPYFPKSYAVTNQIGITPIIPLSIFTSTSMSKEPAGITVQLNGHSGFGQTGNSPTSTLNNMSLSVGTYLAPNHLLGGQIGQEYFPIYSPTDVFEKNVSVFWIGALYRYEMDGIDALGNIQPYIQAVAAGTRSGPLGKATAGILWKPDSKVVLSLGLEGTALVYQYQSASYGTQKLGLNYGVSVMF